MQGAACIAQSMIVDEFKGATAGSPRRRLYLERVDRVRNTIYRPAIGILTNAAGRMGTMCRSIKTLFNFEPPVTDAEIRAASLQFVRKLSGFTHPSKANETSFQQAVDEIEAASRTLLHSLQTNAPAKSREEEAAKARARAAIRFSIEPH
jgi:hypothetical protein